MTTNRDAYALLEQVAALTGCDAQRLLEAAAQQARSTRPDKVTAQLEHVKRAWNHGVVLAWLPPAAPPADSIQVHDDHEGQHDM